MVVDFLVLLQSPLLKIFEKVKLEGDFGGFIRALNLNFTLVDFLSIPCQILLIFLVANQVKIINFCNPLFDSVKCLVKIVFLWNNIANLCCFLVLGV